MPFTLAHPAAVIPLARPLGRFGVPSALVIGSLVPDFAYFLPLGVGRSESHSLPGLVWFCLPVGLASYAVFHLLLASPLLSLLPAVARRLPAGMGRGLPVASWAGVAGSLLIGALTHVVWDAFTHDGTLAVRLLPWLELPLVSIAGYRLLAYKVLQHGSTVLGLFVIAWWGARWLVRTPARAQASHPVLRWPHRVAVVALMLVTVATWTLVSAWPALAGGLTAPALHVFAFRAAVAGLSSTVAVLIAFGAGWHLAARVRSRRG